MNNKLKELSRYCCKPANEQEYEFIKTCARLGGVEFDFHYDKYDYLFYSNEFREMDGGHLRCSDLENKDQIPVTQFCDILLKDKSEFDDRVDLMGVHTLNYSDDNKQLIANDGYKFRLSEDCKTVELIKSKQ